MHLDNLNRIDLNLLVSLNALLEENNVSKAAERLHITQPAMSKTLNRLRDLFDDPLFIRTPKGLDPTPKALELIDPVKETLEHAYKLVQKETFDPKELGANFTIAVPDFLGQKIITNLVYQLYNQAPKVHITLEPWTETSMQDLVSGKIDFGITFFHDAPASIHARKLFSETTYVMLADNHPLAKNESISLKEFVNYPTIQLIIKGYNDDQWLERVIENSGLERKTYLTSSHFLTCINTVRDSQGVCMIAESMKGITDKVEGVSSVPFIYDEAEFNEPVGVHLLWDERYHKSPTHIWLRNVIYECVDLTSE